MPDYIVKTDTTYKIISDHLGSPRIIVNLATGEIKKQITYDEYGNVLSNSGNVTIPFGYAGGLADAQTGLVRFGARDYSSVIGRWNAKDPIGFEGSDYNLYGYTINDPINRYDLNGNTSTLQFALIGFGMSFTQSMVFEHDKIGTAILKGIGGGFAGAILGTLGAGIKIGVEAKALLGGMGFLTGLAASAIGGGSERSANPYVSAVTTSLWTMLLAGQTSSFVGEVASAAALMLFDISVQHFMDPYK